MSNDQSRSLDILGAKPIADSINKVTGAVVDGSAAFLSRICLPAAEEFGLLLRDRVHAWRAANIATMTQRAQKKLAEADQQQADVHAHPRVVAKIIEEGSWTEDPIVQDFWAGLLSASCTSTGDDDSNMIFINLLSQLTKLQARIVDHSCKASKKLLLPNGLIKSEDLLVNREQLVEITGEHDIQRLDRELDHLRELGLIHGGFDLIGLSAETTPTALALHLYVRCQGSRASPIEFFQVTATGLP